MKHFLVFFLLHFGSAVFAQIATRYDIVISEIFADPVPSIGLPESEFIELKNISTFSFNLRDWKISDGSTTASIAVDFLLQPDSFVIICPQSVHLAFALLGATIGLYSFPSINNDKDTIALISPEGKTIHGLAFDKSWYQNVVKSDGGWSLEMRDTFKPCLSKENWTSSSDQSGGTPGKANSMDTKIVDETSPRMISAYPLNSLTISILFDEALDSVSSMVKSNYHINNSIGSPTNMIVQPPLFQSILVEIPIPMQTGKTYELTVNDLLDCSGNSINTPATLNLGLPVSTAPLDIIINEILFNPKTGGSDYIELYHNGNSVLDASTLYIANKNFAGNINAPIKISENPRLIFPGDYLAITEDMAAISLQYSVRNPSAILQIPSLPNFPDEKGTVVILNEKGIIVDELQYDEKWHFALISNREGVALERIEVAQPTQNAENWHSASSDAGYGTPGYMNSQHKNLTPIIGEISLTPGIFSPDNDGFNDVLTISYQFIEQGYVFNLTIFDAVGRPVRYLVRNGLCGTTGFYRWDGLGENYRKLNPGIYILLTEIFNLQGKTSKFKNTVVLARKLDP
jgi:Lamin Tail Domain/CHU_C Type IX secretion signal domain